MEKIQKSFAQKTRQVFFVLQVLNYADNLTTQNDFQNSDLERLVYMHFPFPRFFWVGWEKTFAH